MFKFITPLIVLLLSAWLPVRGGVEAAATQPAAERSTAVHHQLTISLDPDRHRLAAKDRMLVDAHQSVVVFDLAGHLSIQTVTVNGAPARYVHENSRLRVDIGPAGAHVDLFLAYGGTFNDRVPVQPLNTENPGYGVTGTIDERGTMLLAGSGWYPDAIDTHDSYDLVVDAPQGVVAVTAGTPGEVVTENGRSISRWTVGTTLRGLALVAGPYLVNRRTFGDVVAATYFSPALQGLSDDYLASTGHYLQLYESLFGPYPFDQFAVVENFFPTGYGFPSFTLLGRQVLQLPFIRHTSLGHEIAHCWWGNGVLVDPVQGNWSEALTTYVADYLYRERSGRGLQQRRQWLQRYASLVDPAADLPLSQFRHRVDPVTRVVGYDKGAMVFHMLRRLVGEDDFWTTLRQLYMHHRFSAIAWSDLQRAFEKQDGRSLGRFFEQWVMRAGAPRIALADVTVVPSHAGYAVSGKIVQQQPRFQFDLELLVETAQGSSRRTIPVDATHTDFELTAPDLPVSLVADPEAHLFRRLAPEEVPPSINRLKGTDGVHVVVANDLGRRGLAIARRLVIGLGLARAVVDFEDRHSSADLAGADILLVGQPADSSLLPSDTDRLQFSRAAFTLNGRAYSMPGAIFFGVFADALRPDRLVGLYLPGNKKENDAVTRKIPHYGRYGYLVFDGGHNRVKGTWPPGPSPLTVRWAGSRSTRD